MNIAYSLGVRGRKPPSAAAKAGFAKRREVVKVSAILLAVRIVLNMVVVDETRLWSSSVGRSDRHDVRFSVSRSVENVGLRP